MSRSLLIILFTSITFNSEAQTRSFLRDQIVKWGECKNVAMTKTGGDVALKGRNAYASSAIPTAMLDKLSELNGDNKLIDDVQLTENGSWLILFGDNGVTYSGIPTSLRDKIRQFNNDGEIINSITFNDNNEWIIITDKKYAASDSRITNWLKAGEDAHGELWAAHMTNDALVGVYEKGYKFLGEVPGNIRTKLTETDINVYRLKFLSDGSYFFADKKGRYAYHM